MPDADKYAGATWFIRDCLQELKELRFEEMKDGTFYAKRGAVHNVHQAEAELRSLLIDLATANTRADEYHTAIRHGIEMHGFCDCCDADISLNKPHRDDCTFAAREAVK